MHFHEGFQQSLNLQGRQLLLAAVRPENKTQIEEGLHHLSAESIRNRFMGSKKEFTDNELDYLTILDGWDHFALGVVEQGGPKRGVAVVRLVRLKEDSKTAEVAITIIDDYQRIGLGTLLMKLIILAGNERGLATLSFSYLSQNLGIDRLLRKIGHLRSVVVTQGTTQALMSIHEMDPQQLKAELRPFLPLT